MEAALEAAGQREAHLQNQLLDVEMLLRQLREEVQALQVANSELREAAHSANGMEQVGPYKTFFNKDYHICLKGFPRRNVPHTLSSHLSINV